MSRNNRPPQQTFGRLSLERLEARDVPAGYWWNPVGTADFTDPGDWMKGPGAPWDRYTVYDAAPGPTSDLYFDGGVSTANCVIPTQSVTSGNAFASIHLQFGYYTYLTTDTEEVPGEGEPLPPPPPPPPPPEWRAYSGTVTLSNGFDVGTLDVECGQISQGSSTVTSGNGTTLTITSSLDWTGGTLNSNSVAGTIALAPGAGGVAEPSETNPGINGTVQLGSELRLAGDVNNAVGSTLTVKNGIYNLVNGFFRAMAPSILTLAPVPKPVPPPSTPGTPSITIDNVAVTDLTVKVDAGSTLNVTTVGRVSNTDKVDVKVSGGGVQIHNQGTVVIEEYTRLIMAKRPAANFAEYTQNRAVLFDPPVTKLQAGSEIKFEDNGDATKGCFNLAEGELLVTSVSGLSDADQPAAAITAPANPTAPALFVGLSGKVTFHPFHHYVNLVITGDFTCEGEMYLRADGTSDKSDRITATGFVKMQTGQGAGLRVAKLFVSWRIASGGPPAADTTWKVLVIDGMNGGIVTEPIPTIPTVNLPDTLTAGRLMNPKEYGMTFDKM